MKSLKAHSISRERRHWFQPGLNICIPHWESLQEDTVRDGEAASTGKGKTYKLPAVLPANTISCHGKMNETSACGCEDTVP